MRNKFLLCQTDETTLENFSVSLIVYQRNVFFSVVTRLSDEAFAIN